MPSSTSSTPTPDRRRWWYHVLVLALGVVVFVVSVATVVRHGQLTAEFSVILLLGVPLVAVVARFPMILDSGSGAIEVGFDSSILMFLLCTVEPSGAIVVWSLGVVLTQTLASKTMSVRIFNVGVGIIAGALAAGAYAGLRTDGTGTPRELVAVGAAAATYFITDYVLSAQSVAIGARTPLTAQLVQRGMLLAIACFVPLDSLGYLAAVVHRETAPWTLTLLGVPLATLLIATRAVTRGSENARRLTVLFSAAVRAQTLVDRDAVVDGLLRDARQLLRLDNVGLRNTPPEGGEIGVPVQLACDDGWLVARAHNRARATIAGDEQGLRALAAVAADAVARFELTAEMVHVARHDPLTDLPNRGILLDRAADALNRARTQRRRLALLFIDLDGFKPVNDRYGHAAGDAVLVELAARLRACVRERDVVARLGGDEFAILFEDVEEIHMPQMCERVLGEVARPLDLDGQPVHLGASVGLAYGNGRDTAESLLRNADLAMYEAKGSGKGRYVEYEPAMGRARIERLELVDDLGRAVETGQIDVVYQPVVDVTTNRIVGAEALARWRRDDVPVPPNVFIPAAEESGLILPLGDLVLEKVAADAAAMRAVTAGPLAVSVNISAAQLREPTFCKTIDRTVADMDGVSLVLEITERQGVDLSDAGLAAMRAITDLGVTFAIDDFGVGFSSISYLRDLPARIIKADAALSQDVDIDARARALLQSVILMGSTLGFDVVVEGIERDTQLAVLREDAPKALAQGYLLHRPMPLSQLLQTMRDAAQAVPATTENLPAAVAH